MTSTANGTPRICGSYDAVAQSADLHLAIPLDPAPAGIVIRDQVLDCVDESQGVFQPLGDDFICLAGFGYA